MKRLIAAMAAAIIAIGSSTVAFAVPDESVQPQQSSVVSEQPSSESPEESELSETSEENNDTESEQESSEVEETEPESKQESSKDEKAESETEKESSGTKKNSAVESSAEEKLDPEKVEFVGCEIDDIGMHIDLPKDAYIITAGISPDDPALTAVKLTKQEVEKNFSENDTVLKAFAKDRSYDITITVLKSDRTKVIDNLSSLADKELNNVIAELMKNEYAKGNAIRSYNNVLFLVLDMEYVVGGTHVYGKQEYTIVKGSNVIITFQSHERQMTNEELALTERIMSTVSVEGISDVPVIQDVYSSKVTQLDIRYILLMASAVIAVITLAAMIIVGTRYRQSRLEAELEKYEDDYKKNKSQDTSAKKNTKVIPSTDEANDKTEDKPKISDKSSYYSSLFTPTDENVLFKNEKLEEERRKREEQRFIPKLDDTVEISIPKNPYTPVGKAETVKQSAMAVTSEFAKLSTISAEAAKAAAEKKDNVETSSDEVVFAESKPKPKTEIEQIGAEVFEKQKKVEMNSEADKNEKSAKKEEASEYEKKFGKNRQNAADVAATIVPVDEDERRFSKFEKHFGKVQSAPQPQQKNNLIPALDGTMEQQKVVHPRRTFVPDEPQNINVTRPVQRQNFYPVFEEKPLVSINNTTNTTQIPETTVKFENVPKLNIKPDTVEKTVKPETDSKKAVKPDTAEKATKPETDSKKAVKSDTVEKAAKPETDSKKAVKPDTAEKAAKPETDSQKAVKPDTAEKVVQPETDSQKAVKPDTAEKVVQPETDSKKAVKSDTVEKIIQPQNDSQKAEDTMEKENSVNTSGFQNTEGKTDETVKEDKKVKKMSLFQRIKAKIFTAPQNDDDESYEIVVPDTPSTGNSFIDNLKNKLQYHPPEDEDVILEDFKKNETEHDETEIYRSPDADEIPKKIDLSFKKGDDGNIVVDSASSEKGKPLQVKIKDGNAEIKAKAESEKARAEAEESEAEELYYFTDILSGGNGKTEEEKEKSEKHSADDNLNEKKSDLPKKEDSDYEDIFKDDEVVETSENNADESVKVTESVAEKKLSEDSEKKNEEPVVSKFEQLFGKNKAENMVESLSAVLPETKPEKKNIEELSVYERKFGAARKAVSAVQPVVADDKAVKPDSEKIPTESVKVSESAEKVEKNSSADFGKSDAVKPQKKVQVSEEKAKKPETLQEEEPMLPVKSEFVFERDAGILFEIAAGEYVPVSAKSTPLTVIPKLESVNASDYNKTAEELRKAPLSAAKERKPKYETKPKTEINPESKFETKPKTEIKPEIKPEPEIKSESVSKPESQPKPEINTKVSEEKPPEEPIVFYSGYDSDETLNPFAPGSGDLVLPEPEQTSKPKLRDRLKRTFGKLFAAPEDDEE